MPYSQDQEPLQDGTYSAPFTITNNRHADGTPDGSVKVEIKIDQYTVTLSTQADVRKGNPVVNVQSAPEPESPTDPGAGVNTAKAKAPAGGKSSSSKK